MSLNTQNNHLPVVLVLHTYDPGIYWVHTWQKSLDATSKELHETMGT